MSAALESAPAARQDCARCPLLTTCWAPTRRPYLVALTLLACRIKLGIDVNRNLRTLLLLCAPQIRNYAEVARIYTREPVDDLAADLQAALTASLAGFDLSAGKLLPWWFTNPRSTARVWLYELKRKHRGELWGWADDLNDHAATEPESYDEPALSAMERAVEDGKTLTTAEYRAVKLQLLALSIPAAAELCNVSPSDVRKARGTAKRKLADQLGATYPLLRARVVAKGLPFPAQEAVARARREGLRKADEDMVCALAPVIGQREAGALYGIERTEVRRLLKRAR